MAVKKLPLGRYSGVKNDQRIRRYARQKQGDWIPEMPK